MDVFVFKNFNKTAFNKKKREKLFFHALNLYIKDNNIKINGDINSLKISKNNNGKPFIEGENICFNISHSENYWVCAFSKGEVGIDIEKIKTRDYMKFAKRYFAKEEVDFLENIKDTEELKKEFYRIWTVKEAIVKQKGESIFDKVREYKVIENGLIINHVKSLRIHEIYLDKNYICNAVYKAIEEREIKVLNDINLNEIYGDENKI